MIDAGPTKHRFHKHQTTAAADIDAAARPKMVTRQPSAPSGPCVSNVAVASSTAIEATAQATIDVDRSRHSAIAAPNPTTAHAAWDATRRARPTPSSRRRVRVHAEDAAAMPHSAMGVDAAATADRIRLPVEAIAVAAAVDVVVVIIAPASISIVVVGVAVVVGSQKRVDSRSVESGCMRGVERARALPRRFIVPACAVDMRARANDEKRVDFFLFQTNVREKPFSFFF